MATVTCLGIFLIWSQFCTKQIPFFHYGRSRNNIHSFCQLLDICQFSRHGKAEVNVTKPAGKFCPVKPMVEHHGGKVGRLRIIVDDNSAKLIRQWSSFFPPVSAKVRPMMKTNIPVIKSAFFILHVLKATKYQTFSQKKSG